MAQKESEHYEYEQVLRLTVIKQTQIEPVIKDLLNFFDGDKEKVRAILIETLVNIKA